MPDTERDQTAPSALATETAPIVRSAKEIPDDLFIEAVAECSKATALAWGHRDAWANRMDVEAWLSERLGGPVPWKVVLAKARAVIKKGRMTGCPCGCRGDFDLRGFPDDPFVRRDANNGGQGA